MLSVGYFLHVWWLDAVGGLILSLVVIVTWSRTSTQHIKNLTGFSATADQRNVCEYPVLPAICLMTRWTVLARNSSFIVKSAANHLRTSLQCCT